MEVTVFVVEWAAAFTVLQAAASAVQWAAASATQTVASAVEQAVALAVEWAAASVAGALAYSAGCDVCTAWAVVEFFAVVDAAVGCVSAALSVLAV